MHFPLLHFVSFSFSANEQEVLKYTYKKKNQQRFPFSRSLVISTFLSVYMNRMKNKQNYRKLLLPKAPFSRKQSSDSFSNTRSFEINF